MLNLTRQQKHVVVAGFLGWTLDAFDFFIMVFVLKDIAKDFGVGILEVTFAITITLAMRPIGAYIFGRIADRYGRKKALTLNIACYSFLEFLTAFSPNLTVLLILRTLFGIAMGGEWGVGSSLLMETVPTKARGFVSGLLQTGYPMGYLLASIVFALFFNIIGWRGMFMLGVLPALLVLYIRRKIPESPVWETLQKRPKESIIATLKLNWRLAVYAIILMTAFNFFSHGSQDLYPTFLRTQRGLTNDIVGVIAIIYNIGAIIGGISFGSLSEFLGRRKAIMIATLLSLPIIPLFCFSSSLFWLATGAFLIQFCVQGAWGVIPAYLNELSPSSIRATFPGTIYQLGNFLASSNATLQALIANYFNGKYSIAFAIVLSTVAITIFILSLIGPERHGVSMLDS